MPEKPQPTSPGPERRSLEAFVESLWHRFRAEQAHPVDDEDENVDRGTRLAIERTDLALNRSYLATERTLMAWIRTSLSMISFGFTIGKLMPAMTEDQRVWKGVLGRTYSIESVAYYLVLVGTGVLVVAAWQQRRAVQELVQMGLPRKKMSLSFLVAILLACLGLFAFSSLALKI
jgi:putative membrane protein